MIIDVFVQDDFSWKMSENSLPISNCSWFHIWCNQRSSKKKQLGTWCGNPFVAYLARVVWPFAAKRTTRTGSLLLSVEIMFVTCLVRVVLPFATKRTIHTGTNTPLFSNLLLN